MSNPNKEFENMQDTNDETVDIEAVSDETLVMDAPESEDPGASSRPTDGAEEIIGEIEEIDATYQPPSPSEPTGPTGPTRPSASPGRSTSAGTPGPAAYGNPSVLQAASAKLGVTQPDGPIRVGLLVWAAILAILGVITLIGAIAAPVNVQMLFTTMLVVAGIGFIALAIFQNQKKTSPGGAYGTPSTAGSQQFTQTPPAYRQPGQSGQPGQPGYAAQPAQYGYPAQAGQHIPSGQYWQPGQYSGPPRPNRESQGQAWQDGYPGGQQQQPGYPQDPNAPRG